MNASEIFKGLKVIELASVLAGPAVGMFFSELGATVIKIENKRTGGDVTRRWRLAGEDKARDFSAYYCCVNWNKEVVMMDLNDAKDQEQLYELISQADIVIANYRPGSAKKLGVDYEQIKALNPGIIYANLTAFGEESTRPAFDIVLQAETGFLYMTGEPDRPPVRMPVALIDLMAAHQLKEAILIALLKKAKTGEGSYVSTSLYKSALASLANQATNWLVEQHIPQRMGSQHPNIAPYGDIFYTKDEKAIVLAVGTELQFKKLCAILELENLLKDGRFNTNAKRVTYRADLNDFLKEEILKQDSKKLMQQLINEAVPAGLVRNMQEVFEQEETNEMILSDRQADGTTTHRVRTVSFDID